MGTIAFDEHAGAYDAWFMKNPNVLASEVRLIARALRAEGEPGDVLSVGCGSGLFEWLLARDHNLEIRDGVEPAEGMARIAAKRGLRVEPGSAEALPHGDASFDTVLMNGTPAYQQDLAGAFGEARRVLRPGGRLVVGDVPASSSYGMLYRLAGMIGDWGHPHLSKIAPAHPYPIEFVAEANWRTTEEVAAALERTGFQGLRYWQTLTTHARFSNDEVEEPIPGYTRGGYVAICAHT